MEYTVYILHSEKLDKFYVGKTSLTIEERLAYHFHKHKGFTSKSDDWNIVLTLPVDSNKEAILLERKIKKRGANRFILDLEKSG